MKFRILLFSCFLALALPFWSNAQTIIAPAKDPRDAKGISRAGTDSPTNFKQAGDRLAASGQLTDRLVSDVEWIKKYAATITPEDLEAHLRFIASDELEGRETGTRGQKIAARYLATQFQKMGLKPGNKGEWYQTYELNRLKVTSATASLTGKDELKISEDFICFDKSSLASNLELEYAFAGYGISANEYDNLNGVDLKGKMAVVLNGEPVVNGKSLISGTEEASEWAENPNLKEKALVNQGAKAALVIVTDETFKGWTARPWVKNLLNSSSLKLAYLEDGGFPTFYISESTANGLLKKGKTTVEVQKKALNNSAEVAQVDLSKAKFSLKTDASNEVVTAENVLGFIEGTDKKDEVVVITAHFDHLGIRNGEIYNGADDDGTGTVALLEIAEAFMAAVQDGHRPRRSILFMPVSGEEKGLLGSEYYSDHPAYPIAKTVCDLNIDMIGRVDEKHKGEPQYIYVIGSDRLSTQLHVANESANKVISNLELDYTFNAEDDPNQFYFRSDHFNFAKHDIPVIFYFSGVHEDYHKPTDDIEKILFPRATRVAQLVFTTAWEAANRDQKFVVDKPTDYFKF